MLYCAGPGDDFKLEEEFDDDEFGPEDDGGVLIWRSLDMLPCYPTTKTFDLRMYCMIIFSNRWVITLFIAIYTILSSHILR